MLGYKNTDGVIFYCNTIKMYKSDGSQEIVEKSLDNFFFSQREICS